MAFIYKQIKFRFFELFPLLFLFFISLNGNSLFDLKFFSINVHYILVYFWVLRKPEALGYGFIFLSGLITDVVYGLPLGINSLSLLTIAAVAAYVRVVTVRITLINDWISFIPAVLVGNFIYFLSLYFSDYSIDYFFLFKNSIFTFIFYPVLWGFFSLIINITKS
jgi:cell shape-determining protein MreD